MKDLISKFLGYITGLYLVRLINYNLADDPYRHQNEIRKDAISFIFGLFFKKRKEKIDELFCKFMATSNEFIFSIQDPLEIDKLLREGTIFLNRRVSNKILQWLFHKEIFFFGDANKSYREEITSIFSKCCVYLKRNDMNKLLELIISKCEMYHADREKWGYSEIGWPIVYSIEYMSGVCLREDLFEKCADYMVEAGDYYCGSFPSYKIVNFYFRAKKDSAMKKMLEYTSNACIREWDPRNFFIALNNYSIQLSLNCNT